MDDTLFISLLMLRILSMETEGQFFERRLIESLRKANVDLLEMNKYKGVYYDEVLKCIDDAMGTNLDRRYWNLQDIKKLIAGTKQGSNPTSLDFT